MFKNYLKISFRNLLKNKVFSLINIFGLAIGMAACLLISQYVMFELSYDSFHRDHNDIYRVECEYIRNGEQIFNSAENFPGVGPEMKKEFGEVSEFARFYNAGAKFNCTMIIEGEKGAPVSFREKKFYYADASIFSMFSFELIKGDPKTALSEPNTAVISESTARKYFGSENPIGKLIRMNDDASHEVREDICKITGIFKDIPENSHLKFNILFSYKTLYTRRGGVKRYETGWWGRDNFYTYILVEPNADPNILAAKFPAFIDKYKPSYTEVNSNNERIRSNIFTLQPLQDIYLYSSLKDEAEINGNSKTVYFLLIIALFILMIAWVNYINLSTARSMERAKEVGVRKVTGATRSQLVKQFIFESILLNVFAAIIAIGLVKTSLPLFYQLTGKTFSLWSDVDIWKYLFAIFILGAFLSGIYPAFILSSFKPVVTLKGRSNEKGKGNSVLRQGLVIFQFAASVILIAGTFTVYKQLNFMREKNLGFNPDQILIIERPGIDDANQAVRSDNYKIFKTELLKYPQIKNVTGSSTIPGLPVETGLAVSRTKNAHLDDVRSIPQIWIDHDFIDAYKMTILAGRNFSGNLAIDDSAVVLNESAVKQLGFKDPEDAVGQDIFLFVQRRHKVIGVVKDYHHESLKKTYSAAIFKLQSYNKEYLSLKISTTNLSGTIGIIEEKWKQIFPGNPFEYFFLDRFFNEQYKADQQFGKIFGVFSVLAVIIASLGLFALSSFNTIQRTKEIGIRKVLGASISNILFLLSKDFIKLVLIANIIAWPIIYFLANNWLANFAFQISVNWQLFILPGIMVVFIALCTISYQSIKTAQANPVEALRYE